MRAESFEKSFENYSSDRNVDVISECLVSSKTGDEYDTVTDEGSDSDDESDGYFFAWVNPGHLPLCFDSREGPLTDTKQSFFI